MTIAIASSLADIKTVKKLRKPKNLKILVTTLEAKKAAESLKIPVEDVCVSIDKKNLQIINKKAAILYRSIISNSELLKILTINGLNPLTFISNRLLFFLNRMVLASLEIEKIKFLQDCKKIILSKDDVFGFIDSPYNQKYLPLALYIWCKGNPKTKLSFFHHSETKMALSYYKWTIGMFNRVSNLLIYLKNGYVFNKKDILLVLPANHAVQIISLLLKLKHTNIKYLVIVHNLKIKDRITLLKYGINFIDRDSLKNGLIEKKAERNAFIIRRRWKKSKRAIRFINENTRKALYFNDTIFFRINNFINKEVKQIFMDLLIAKKNLRMYKPRILVTTTDPDQKVSPFIFLAKENDIETITIQHGTYAISSTANFLSDKVFVWGDYYKNWFKKYLKKDPDKIIVSGSPFFDNLKFIKLNNNKKITKNHHVLILISGVITMPIEKELHQILRELIKLGVKKIYVRAHPWQKLYIEQNLFPEKGVIAANHESLNYFLKKSRIVITTNTTAGFEALIMGKQVIYWDFFGSGRLPFGSGGIPVVQNSKELINVTAKIFDGKYMYDRKKIKKLISEIFYKLDGKSGLRIIDMIKRDLNNNYVTS